MEAIIEHNTKYGAHIQVAHGKGCLSLVVSNQKDSYKHVAGVVLTPDEAIDLGLDLIFQARHALS